VQYVVRALTYATVNRKVRKRDFRELCDQRELKDLLVMLHSRVTRGRCYDQNFLRFSTIFGEKIGVFLKNQCYDQIFAQFSFAFDLKTPIFSPNFSAKIFLTS
jgi:S-adenosylmethionine:tRNA-ribosyltransferase-isomerase (queuine synthetase)